MVLTDLWTSGPGSCHGCGEFEGLIEKRGFKYCLRCIRRITIPSATFAEKWSLRRPPSCLDQMLVRDQCAEQPFQRFPVSHGK